MKCHSMMLFGLAFVVTTSACGQANESAASNKSQPQEANSELKTLKSKISYSIGLTIGGNLKRDKLDVDPKLIARGIQDALSGSDPLLTPEQVQAVFQEMQQESQKKAEMQASQNQKEGADFLASNGKRKGVTTTKSGLQYEVIRSGKGATPKATDTVKAHYHGTLIDGTVFDSSVERDQPFNSPVNRVIAGWTEALQLMKVGDKWKLFVPPDLAYGKRGSPPKIGPDTVLIFEIELLGIDG